MDFDDNDQLPIEAPVESPQEAPTDVAPCDELPSVPSALRDNPTNAGQHDEGATGLLFNINDKHPGGRGGTRPIRRGDKYNTYLSTPGEREAQGALMLARRITMNERISEIAKHFNVSSHTVVKRLKDAKNGDLIETAKTFVAGQLFAKALAVYDQHLDEANLEAAKDILFGSAILQKQTKTEMTHSTTPTLDAIRAERVANAQDAEIVPKKETD